MNGRSPGVGRSPSRKGMLVTSLIVASAFFMEQLDATILATALPRISQALHTDPVRANILLTAYLLSLTIFIPASGQIADRFGARKVFCAAVILFTVASFLCGRAASFEALAAFRFLQGAGGAMMVPVGRLVVLRTADKSEVITAMSWVLMPAMVAPVLGPLVGGFIVTYWDWNWIFYINVPFGLVSAGLAWSLIKDPPTAPPRRPFDLKGQALAGSALCCLMIALETLDSVNVASPLPLGFLAAAGGFALLYVRHGRSHPSPALDLRLLRITTFNVSVGAGTLFRIGIGALPYLLPLMLQIGFGLSPVASGSLTLASAIAGFFMKTITVPILRAFGFRRALLFNGAVTGLFLCLCGAFRPSWPVWAIYAVLIAGGLARSLQFNIYGSLAFADVPAEAMSAATSLFSTMQQVSLTIGIAFAASALRISAVMSGDAVPRLDDFTIAFVAVGFLSALSVPASRALAPDAGAQMSGHRRLAA